MHSVSRGLELIVTMVNNEPPRSLVGRLSVAMCTYNGAGFLSQQLNSILSQTELPDELVVCDDGSTDDTVSILEAFAASAPFVVCIHRNVERLKSAQNFAKCFSFCSGDVIVITDQDDVWFPDRIANTRAAFANDPALTFTFSDAPLIDDHGNDLGRTLYSSLQTVQRDRKHYERGTCLLQVILRCGAIYGCTMAFRANLLPLILPIPEMWGHDGWVAVVLSAVGPSARLSPVTHYRQHPRQFAGAGNWKTKTRFEKTSSARAKRYESEIRLHELAIDAVQSKSELRQLLLPALHERLRFLHKRLDVRLGGLHELPSLVRLLYGGDYNRHGSGFTSALKDLLRLLAVLPESRQ